MSSDSILDLANSVEPTADDLLRVNQETEGFPEGERNVEAGMFMVGKLFKGEFKRATAVFFGMRALPQLLESEGGVPGWTLPRLPDGGIPTEEAVFAAAATQPMIEVDGDISFYRESLMARVLELAELEAQG
ncbi:MAG TPA: hypothetical protein VLB76_19690 [Thermoanaerobaculia bacterium]|nr:hypothetical protein [Thermoanaerobaculia bacterium]